MNRRTMVGVVSLAVGVLAMGWLVSQRDRFHTRTQESMCRQGDPDVCLRLSEMYFNAEGVSHDERLHWEFYEQACAILDARCREGDRDACFRLGAVLRRDLPRTIEAFARACDAGLAQACKEAADRCRPEPRMWAFVEKACVLGDFESCFERVSELEREKRPADALRWRETACARGSGRACYAASEILQTGSGVDANPARAEALAREATAALDRECAAVTDEDRGLGYQHPCGLLANLLATGRGGTRDDARVFGLWQKACEGGSKDACRAIGDPRGYGGLLVQRIDTGATRGSERRDCEKGMAWACVRAAAEIYSSGNELSGDPTIANHYEERATKLFLQACEKGQADACEEAGNRLRVGRGAPRDVAAARRAFEKAKLLKQ
jgi:TPR repeat protein